MISFTPLGKTSQITKRPVSTNFWTPVGYKVFNLFEHVEVLIISCFIKPRCKALDLFSYTPVIHNNMFLLTEQISGEILLFCIRLRRLLCYMWSWKRKKKAEGEELKLRYGWAFPNNPYCDLFTRLLQKLLRWTNCFIYMMLDTSSSSHLPEQLSIF